MKGYKGPTGSLLDTPRQTRINRLTGGRFAASWAEPLSLSGLNPPHRVDRVDRIAFAELAREAGRLWGFSGELAARRASDLAMKGDASAFETLQRRARMASIATGEAGRAARQRVDRAGLMLLIRGPLGSSRAGYRTPRLIF